MNKEFLSILIISLLIIGTIIIGYFLWNTYACIDISSDCACISGYDCSGCTHKRQCNLKFLIGDHPF